MDTSMNSSFSELGMENPFCNDEYDIMDFFDEELSAALGHNFQSTNLSPEGMIPSTNSATIMCASSSIEPVPVVNVSTVMEAPPGVLERPAEQLKRTNTPIILTFGNPSLPEMNPQQVSLETLNHVDNAVLEGLTSHCSFASSRTNKATKSALPKTMKTGGPVRSPSQTYYHIIAERKRREHLSQLFMALSAIVPGLKKRDKTSVLGDAIAYLKHLKKRVKILEEQATEHNTESVVVVMRSQLLVHDKGSSDETGGRDEQPLPQIEAKLCDKKVLLRVHCENHKAVLIKLLSEVEKLNLAVINTSIAPFGSLAIDITIIAEIKKEFNKTMKEIIRSLGSALHRVGQDA